MRVDAGHYTGNDVAGENDPQTISLTKCTGDLQGTDSFIMVVPYGNDDIAYGVTNTTDDDNSHKFWAFGGDVANKITNLVAGAFDVEGALNEDGSEYLYLILQYDGTTRDFETGQYTGDGQDNKADAITYTNTGTEPVFVISCSETRFRIIRTNEGQGDESNFFSDINVEANQIQSFAAANCVIGSDRDINDNGISHHYLVAWGVTGVCAVKQYDGNDADPREVTVEVGMQPEFSFVVGDHNQDYSARADLADCGQFNARVTATDTILSHFADGIEVSDNIDVNDGTPIVGYYAYTFRESSGTAAPAPAAPKLHTPMILNVAKLMDFWPIFATTWIINRRMKLGVKAKDTWRKICGLFY